MRLCRRFSSRGTPGAGEPAAPEAREPPAGVHHRDLDAAHRAVRERHHLGGVTVAVERHRHPPDPTVLGRDHQQGTRPACRRGEVQAHPQLPVGGREVPGDQRRGGAGQVVERHRAGRAPGGGDRRAAPQQSGGVALAPALGVGGAGPPVGGRESRELRGRGGAALAQHRVDRLPRVVVVACRRGAVGAPQHVAHQRGQACLAGGVALGEEAEEDPHAVVPPVAGELVHRPTGLRERAAAQVLHVVVDVVVHLVLDPGRGGLEEPAVLEEVVGVLDGVEVLVRRRDLQLLQVGVAGVDGGVVVVEHAVGVAAVVVGVARRLALVGGAVAVEAARVDLTDVDVDEVGAAAQRAVTLRPLVAGLRVGAVHAVEGGERGVDIVGDTVATVVGEAGRVGRAGHVVHAHHRAALRRGLRHRVGDRAVAAAGVRGPPVERPCLGLPVGRQVVDHQRQVAQRQCDLGTSRAGDGTARRGTGSEQRLDARERSERSGAVACGVGRVSGVGRLRVGGTGGSGGRGGRQRHGHEERGDEGEKTAVGDHEAGR